MEFKLVQSPRNMLHRRFCFRFIYLSTLPFTYSDKASSGCRERNIIVANMLPLHIQRDPNTPKLTFSFDEESLLWQLKDGFSPDKSCLLIVFSAYKRSNRRAIFLDYDGILIPHSSIMKSPSPELITILNTLCDDPKNTMFIVIGRGKSTLSEWLSPCERLGLAAEHGCYVRTLDPEVALGSRDALAKTVYSCLFDWIVEKIKLLNWTWIRLKITNWCLIYKQLLLNLLVNLVQVNTGNIDELVANQYIIQVLAPMKKHKQIEQILGSQEPRSKIISFVQNINMCIGLASRTGRDGATGEAYTFFEDQDAKHASDLVKLLEGANQRVPAEIRDMASRGGGGNKFKRWGSNPSFGGRDGGQSVLAWGCGGTVVVYQWVNKCKQLTDVGSMWEGQNTSATCAMIRYILTRLHISVIGCEDGLMEANAREQAREREWQQNQLKKFTDSPPLRLVHQFQNQDQILYFHVEGFEWVALDFDLSTTRDLMINFHN
ncbi:probable alpha,alpha-trehalose-phosphate synthase [UDP-forming] 10 [Tanacetum coccineum]